jgi:hypothetical protein
MSEQPTIPEQGLLTMLRKLPVSITITLRDGVYLWQCLEGNGTAETAIHALDAALHFLIGAVRSENPAPSNEQLPDWIKGE